MILLDLDGFKTVNDSLGHQAGDDLLVTLAGRLRSCLRPDDTIARMGGDEFAVLLENTSEGLAFAIAAQLLAVVRKPICIQGRMITSHLRPPAPGPGDPRHRLRSAGRRRPTGLAAATGDHRERPRPAWADP